MDQWEDQTDGNEKPGRNHDNRENHDFIKGLFCGVVLVLICLWASVTFYRYRTNRLYKEMKAEQEARETETETQLDLDLQRVEKKVLHIEKLINQHFLKNVNASDVEDLIYTGMVAGLGDPYSVYYTAEDLQSMSEAISGEYSGIGIKLSKNPYTGIITVISCFEDTPAFEAGIQPGDVILKFNGEAVIGMELEELVSRIKKGDDSQIKLQLQRDDELIEVEVKKREIKIPTVTAEMLDDQMGYIKIMEFDSVTGEQFTNKLETLEKEGMKSLIIDLRNNPGGLLQTVCDMLNRILPQGLIVYTEDKDGNRSEYFSDGQHELKVPLVVLVNENSASASEIFAGAVKDYEKGVLVGTTTFGKGIVQKTYYMSDGTGVKLTVAKYYTPKGNDIHEKGVEPDVMIDLDETVRKQAVIEKEEDTQLQKAIQILNEKNEGQSLESDSSES